MRRLFEQGYGRGIGVNSHLDQEKAKQHRISVRYTHALRLYWQALYPSTATTGFLDTGGYNPVFI
ncbi:hypothetical protein [uncultured Porticoccus sp.]|uniref:hypothetical protein n=1 Tax=uncultured Porticoccus sp. TaxID=1256050 RepID=UPI002618CA00|nr:hypothetical protein [uncultured Porticoccus sp.]